ncbi:hypothetical protein [Sphingomonas sp. PB4P5]|uniref:hypothetical protein n=1 Tax=Parasphingomonas puruogangriensis TaxID=3096155 RepID=UPI002FC8B2B8
MKFYKTLSRMALGCAAITAAASALPAQTGGFDGFIDDPMEQNFDVFQDSPEWKYFRTPGYCYASAENERGVLLVGYDRRRNQAHVGFWNKDLTSYRTADTTYLEIILINVIPGVGLSDPNREWGSNKFLIGVNRGGQRVFNAKLNGAQVLTSFSKFDRLGFMNADATIIQNFDLTHSARAMNRLRACVPR